MPTGQMINLMRRAGWTSLEPRQRHVLMSTVSANALIFLDQTAITVAFSLARPAVFTPASVGPFMTLPSAQRAFAASLVTDARQLGAVLRVAVMGVAYTAAGSTRLSADPDVVSAGFRAAMFTAAGVAALAAVVATRMPNVTANQRSAR